MSKPVYEIPIGDGEVWPSAGRRSAAAEPDAFAGYTPSSPPAPAFDALITGSAPAPGYEQAAPPSYANAAPPTTASADYTQAPPPAYPTSQGFPPPAAFPPPAFGANTESFPSMPPPSAPRSAPLGIDAAPQAASPASPAAPTDPYAGLASPSVAAAAANLSVPSYAPPAAPAALAAPASAQAPASAPAPFDMSAFAAPATSAPAVAPAPAPAPVPPAYPAPASAVVPASAPAPVQAPAPAASAPAPANTALLDVGRSGAHALPPQAVPAAASGPAVIDLSPQVGEGEEGSDPDLVAALNAVVTARASDLHVTAKTAPMIRVDGGLRPAPGFEEWDSEKVESALHSIMSERNRAIFEEKLELDFAYRLSDSARFRVNVYQQRNSMGAAFRLIPTEIKQLASLGVPESIGSFAKLARGLVLVTGPTGSGKSTTLAALIDLVNSTRADHIVTVEDPIEFMHTNKKSVVNQREVGHDTHSFQNALKHVLRQDPDVILIGELRDLETISVALTAAETGHLVFATLHTSDAPQTIDRVIDVFPPHQQGQVRAQLAATLQGVVCQTLVKKIGGGRAVATEILITTPAVSNLIREGKTYQVHSSMQAGRELGMHTMDQHLADLVNAGQITYEVASEKVHDIEVLKRLVTRTGGTSDAGVNFGDSYSNGQV